eukprot:1765256-Amphidinium_carterae.1
MKRRARADFSFSPRVFADFLNKNWGEVDAAPFLCSDTAILEGSERLGVRGENLKAQSTGVKICCAICV